MTHKKLYVLTGATAVGKTELSLRWAEENNAEILSCDSLLFYRGMDIGTAKPGKAELERVIHHGIDLINVDEQYNVANYITYAKETINDIHARGKEVLIVGGSGFYLKAFFSPVTDGVMVSDDIKAAIEAIEKQSGLAGLLNKLNEWNTEEDLSLLDCKNPRRVVSALGRCWASGKSIRQLKKEFSMLPSAFAEYPKTLTLLQRNRVHLKERVRMRVEKMLGDGLVNEVQKLMEEGIEKNPSAANSIGYRETITFLKTGGSVDALADAICVNTMQLIRKQEIFFRYQISPDKILDLDTKASQPLF